MIDFVKDLASFVSLCAFSGTALLWVDLLQHLS